MKAPKIRQYKDTYLVGESIWNLKFKRQVEPTDGKNRETVGLCDPSEKQVSIRLSQSKEDTLKTFIHEFLHAFEDEYEINLKHSDVYKLEEAIYHFLVDNF